jgi:hypothetical protein
MENQKSLLEDLTGVDPALKVSLFIRYVDFATELRSLSRGMTELRGPGPGSRGIYRLISWRGFPGICQMVPPIACPQLAEPERQSAIYSSGLRNS